jgi:serine phosphatase RsbU (regulator of sigma subunit)/PAS domain-containing protein
MSAPEGRELDRLAALAQWLRGELDSSRAGAAARAVTERATGILMERLGCPAGEARQQLDRLAASAGVTPEQVAADIAGEPAAALPPRQLRQVTRADAAAAGATDADRLAEALLEEALAAEGVDAVALWLLAPDGGMELAGQAGLGPAEASRWRRVPPGVAFLPLRAAREDAEAWWPAGPPPGNSDAVIGRTGSARAVIPLRHRGACIGALEACWPSPLESFPASARGQLPALAGPCAQALAAGMPPGALPSDYSQAAVLGVLDGLGHSVLFARAIRDDHQGLAGLVIEWASDGFSPPAGQSARGVTGRRLLEVYPEAGRPGGLLDAAARALEEGQPQQVADMPLAAGTVTQVRIVPVPGGVLIGWQDADEIRRLAALLEQAQWLGQVGGWEENLLTGQVHWADATCAIFGLPHGTAVRLAELDQRVPAGDLPAVQAFRDRLASPSGMVTAAFRIIRAGDGSVRQVRATAGPVTGPGGELIAVRGAYQDVSDRYHAQAAFTVTRQQLARTEQRAREEHELAVRLQQAITPEISQPVEAAGIEVAARYRPASQQHLVGGDWYDAVLLPGKDVLLAVGDITGHGIGAVTGMVSLRNHLRGLAVTGAGPAALLTWLNSAAFHLADTMATAICAIYDPASRTLRWARAGHLPPLVIRGGTASVPAMPDGRLLGISQDARYEEETLQLQLGDTIVLFTDGLIERRGQPVDEALAHLAQLASAHADDDVGQFAGSLLAATPSDTGDDTCLLAVRIR